MLCNWDRGWETTAELHSRMEELERLKDQMQVVGMYIVKAVGDRTLNMNRDYILPTTTPLRPSVCISLSVAHVRVSVWGSDLV